MKDTDGLFALEQDAQVPIARVLVDLDLPHLDHPLDYSIPEELDADIEPGTLVQVKVAGKKYLGWVIERTHTQSSLRTLQPILSVLSSFPLLLPQTYELARYIARKHVSTVTRLLSFAIPPRHVTTEKKFNANNFPSQNEHTTQPPTEHTPLCVEAWRSHEYGVEFIDALRSGRQPRAVWSAIPPTRDEQLQSVINTVCHMGKQTIIVLPTHAQVQRYYDYLCAHDSDMTVCMYTSEMPPAQRYATYLGAMAGHYDVIIGTRSAAWLPAPDLGIVVIWDDGDDRLREQRSPHIDALDVAVARSQLHGCALLVGAYGRSVKAQSLVRSGWAVSLVAHREIRHHNLPRLSARDEYEIDREGASAHSQISAYTQGKIRKALEHGSVLIQVPLSGFVPRISCQRCRTLARCATCQGQLSVTSSQHITCQWCARDVTQWTCQVCGAHEVRANRVGSDLTSERLGRSFPGVSLIQSNARHPVTEELTAKSRLVIATPGSEPSTEGGYVLVVVVDPDAIASRPELWAPEEALRRWMNAFSLLSQDGEGIIDGSVDPLLAQSLIRWDPTVLVNHLLDERYELSFFPATTIVALSGESHDIHTLTSTLPAELMGTQVLACTADTNSERIRTLIRTSKADTPELLESLARVQQERSSRKLPLIKMEVNPPELFA